MPSPMPTLRASKHTQAAREALAEARAGRAARVGCPEGGGVARSASAGGVGRGERSLGIPKQNRGGRCSFWGV